MTMKLFDLTGRLALVTGSSKGIGLALARALASAGASVVLNARDTDRLEAARAALTRDGYTVHAAAFDVTDPEAVEHGVADIEAQVGPIEILVNNAGVQHRTPLQDFPLEAWRRLTATNLDSVFLMGQAVARRMIGRGHGKIINICSVQSELARPGIAPYTATKGAVKMLTKGMATDWGRLGLQVNGIGPGYFRTELNRPSSTTRHFRAGSPIALRWRDGARSTNSRAPRSSSLRTRRASSTAISSMSTAASRRACEPQFFNR